MKEDDKISENHKMQDHPKSLWQKFKILACPCFKFQLSIQEDNNQFSKADQTNESYIKQKTMQFNDQIRRTKRKNSLQSHEIKQSLIKNSLHLQKSYRESVNLQRQNSLHGQYEIDCSISNFTEDHLISIGIKAKHLLVKISTVKINLSIQLLKKMMRNMNRSIQSADNKQYHNFQFNRFWNQRYILFGKFDQGIKIDQQSWSKILPQKASQYIAGKCNGAKKILEGFAGIGGTTIKLADINSISKVIANDHNKKKVEFLLNNLKVYEVDSKVELSNCDFLKIQMKNVDVVVIKPPIRHFIGHRNINITDFDPSLDKIINKSMRLSDNIIMILPPQTNIDVLCSCLNTCASELKKMRNYSSIKIQKIVSQKQIKCILVLIGPLVQTQIKLNEQLQYIYKRLKKGGDGYFKHKKVLKKIRQENGMLNLFNYIKQCESIKRQKTKCNPKQEYHLIDIFYDYIVNRKIICKQKLKKIIQEQNAQFQRQSSYHISLSLHNQEPFDEYNSSVMEEQKMDENSFQLRKQLTQSQCSHYSYNSGNSKKSMQKSIVEQWRSLKGQKSGSIIIKRQEMPMQLYDFSEMKKKITEISQEQSKYNNSYEL